ncbi:hypothetical protein [Nocardia sp. XZ_19_385]|uniref:hypothetical protein n=1 Tax=Nocardia sp. XZ_19_385 TaxID=2769488 RepID=UPI00281696AA|nr:hypothetical protein [Nocardia sp. XZ_19_385]
MRTPAEEAARLRPAPSAAATGGSLSGALVGSACGAVSIAAHALGGGVVSLGDSSVALLLGACALIGVVVSVLRRSAAAPGLGELVLLLMAGQAVGHTALTLSPCHQQVSHSAGLMLLAHVLAVPVGALLIRAAELGLARAASSVREAVRALHTRPVAPHAPFSIVTVVPALTARRLLISSGIGTRGPPAYA